jgi:phospholipid/cholesterol/gamma-HCH transport system substrate-binding protein
MKFKIRYADQIVGLLSILAIVALAFVIFMLGSKQRWFARDYRYYAVFTTASGITPGMPIQYRGFTIGNVKKTKLEPDDRVIVDFSIYSDYHDRVMEGSLVELFINPIGLGNAFYFHPGRGTEGIAEGSEIPRMDSVDGKAIIESGLANIPKRDDTLPNIVAQINPLLTNINGTLEQLNAAFAGKGKGPLADTMTGVGKIALDISEYTGEFDSVVQDIKSMTAHLEALTRSPHGFVPSLIDPDGTMFDNLEKSLASVSGTLDNVEDASSILKSQVPQIARMIEDLRIALVAGQDVLEGLRNNPLLRGGITDRVQTDASGTNSRNIEF